MSAAATRRRRSLKPRSAWTLPADPGQYGRTGPRSKCSAVSGWVTTMMSTPRSRRSALSCATWVPIPPVLRPRSMMTFTAPSPGAWPVPAAPTRDRRSRSSRRTTSRRRLRPALPPRHSHETLPVQHRGQATTHGGGEQTRTTSHHCAAAKTPECFDTPRAPNRNEEPEGSHRHTQRAGKAQCDQGASRSGVRLEHKERHDGGDEPAERNQTPGDGRTALDVQGCLLY